MSINCKRYCIDRIENIIGQKLCGLSFRYLGENICCVSISEEQCKCMQEKELERLENENNERD